MYNVLTIDLDYIAEPYIQLYHMICNEASVEKQWEVVFSEPALVSNNFDINPDNVIYALDTFSRSLAVCKNVAFGITHDSILFELEDKDELSIVNIDHHHDILYPGNHAVDLDFGLVYEGSWIEYLHRKSKIKDYVWIRNENSFNIDTHSTLMFSSYLKTEYKYEEVPDLIYVCLSPTYIPKFHWFYFKIFMNMYKAFCDGEIRFYKKPYKNSPYSDPMRGYEDFLQEVVN
jgi:hypothetical protein|tara:strand:- start:301 stop:993 length:693 start_codon:yes stop_codon:yes gene_type:complete